LSILRYTIPNSFTALSLLLGIASIIMTQLGDLEFAAWIIVWCGLLDVLDGVSARILKATSNFGAEFDSMADLVSFGVAPAVLVLNAGLQIANIKYGSNFFWLLSVAVAVFVLTGAMRLARFNLTSEETSKGWFAGVPITATGGGFLAPLILVLMYHDEIATSLALNLFFPVLMFFLSILMISSMRFPKATRRESNLINAFQIIAICGIYYSGITRTYPEYLLGMSLFLLVAGIIAGRVTKNK
tara:strand:- start:7226 stop:7954 length:729 start_codon:yes stop_codon:yes gene_type:complete